MTSPSNQAEVEQSIAAANATAADTTVVPLKEELAEMAGELERHVYQIGQLHSRVRLSVSFREQEGCDGNTLL